MVSLDHRNNFQNSVFNINDFFIYIGLLLDYSSDIFPILLKVCLHYKDYSELTMLLFSYPPQQLGTFPKSDY